MLACQLVELHKLLFVEPELRGPAGTQLSLKPCLTLQVYHDTLALKEPVEDGAAIHELCLVLWHRFGSRF